MRYRGLAVSEGLAVGAIYLGDDPVSGALGDDPGAVTADQADVERAFGVVATARTELAARLRERGESQQAGIVEIGALIAADPALITPVLAAMREGTDAVTAIGAAAAAQADLLAALPDPDLAQRAGDVRQVASAVLDELRGVRAAPPPDEPFILVREEVDPAELIRLADSTADELIPAGTGQAGAAPAGAILVGAVSVGGGATSHAAIVARGLGLPMLAGADRGVLDAPSGHRAILDAGRGELIVDPSAAAVDVVVDAVRVGVGQHGPGRPDGISDGVVATADGQRVTVLCNVASAAETRLGLSAGAAGVGLLRTEIPFSGATGWPSETDHLAALTPVLALLSGRPVTVRLLDFSNDKIPPFLTGAPLTGGPTEVHGLTALLGAPDALDAQLRAILRAGRDTRLAIMIPMVTAPAEVDQVRARLADAAHSLGVVAPPLGIMVEVAATAAHAEKFTPVADFFSIGTNDLTSDVLGLDRSAASPALAADAKVQALIGHVVRSAADAGINVSVCGDSAGDPAVLPLLLRQGIRTLSVGAARVPRVANWIAASRAVQ
jgi:phosphoenolpyruvate-protein kinase (PTS system EI component)